MKRLPEKLTIAAIILSCGFIMPAEDEDRAAAKRSTAPADAPRADVKAANGPAERGDRAPW